MRALTPQIGLHLGASALAERTVDDYSCHLADVAAQLATQLPSDIGTLVLIPVVGFAMQSHRVLPTTIAQLAAQRMNGPFTVVMLVNRPAHRGSDGTEELIHREIARHGVVGKRFAVASVVVAGRPRVGALRQLLHDAVTTARGTAGPSDTVVVADDDIVHAPQGMLESLARGLRAAPGCDAVVGPVLFDDDRIPSVLLPDFFVADLLRALLAARWVARLARASSLCAARAGACWQRYAESIALSSNMAVRSEALVATGGFPPFNEITGILQRLRSYSICRSPLNAAARGPVGIADIWNFDADRPDVIDSLLDSAVRLSSRRALRAWVESGAPSVAQWRACRFHASRADPARQGLSPSCRLAMLDKTGRRDPKRLVESTAALVGITLAAFPPDADTARDALRALGLDSRRCTAELPEREGAPWHVRIHDPDIMLARALATQRRVMSKGSRGLTITTAVGSDDA